MRWGQGDADQHDAPDEVGSGVAKVTNNLE